MKNFLFLSVLMTGFVLTGCASIIGSTSETITVSSSVEGAKLTVYDEDSFPVWGATTPTAVRLKKKSGYFSGNTYSLKLEKPGYQTQMKTLDTELSVLYWGNLIFGGVLGLFIVDPLTGAMWTFEDDKVYFDMHKEEK